MTVSRFWIALAVVSLGASTALADDGYKGSFTLTPFATDQFTSSYGEASVHIARVGANLDHTYPINDRLKFGATLKFEDSVYDFNDFKHESPGVKTPIDNAWLWRLTPNLTYVANEHWIFQGGALLQSSSQVGADFGDTLTYGAYGLVMYRVNENLTIGGGAAYYTLLEDGSSLLPLLSIEWKINDQWRFTGRGTEARISYFPQPQVSVYVAGSYDTREYRLEESAPYSNGVLTDDSVPVRLGCQWTPTDQLTIAGEVGAIISQTLTFDDSKGHRIVKDDVDPTVFIGLQFSYKF